MARGDRGSASGLLASRNAAQRLGRNLAAQLANRDGAPIASTDELHRSLDRVVPHPQRGRLRRAANGQRRENASRQLEFDRTPKALGPDPARFAALLKQPPQVLAPATERRLGDGMDGGRRRQLRRVGKSQPVGHASQVLQAERHREGIEATLCHGVELIRLREDRQHRTAHRLPAHEELG